MEASSLKIKKQFQKGKLKKTMKNIICRPDPSFWPVANEEEGKIITEELNNLKVDIPEFKKLCWSELSQIPKDLRQKPAPIPKVNGLIFGITECKKAIETQQCIGVLIDADVNPKTIVLPLLDICMDRSIPVLCLKQLRDKTDINFRIPTSVLGVKGNYLPDLEEKFLKIAKHRTAQDNTTEACPKTSISDTCEVNMDETPAVDKDKDMITTVMNSDLNKMVEPRKLILSPYLYRVLKSIRVFSPTIEAKLRAKKNETLKSSSSVHNEETGTNSKQFISMNVKKISSNPNRKKVSKANPKE